MLRLPLYTRSKDMVDDWLAGLRRALPNFQVVQNSGPVSYQLSYQQQSFSLFLKPSTYFSLHLILVPTAYTGCKTPLLIQRCMEINSNSYGLYLTINKTGGAKVHAECSAREGVGKVAGLMIQWYLAQEPRLLATASEEKGQTLPQETTDMGETLRNVAAMLHLKEFTFNMNDRKVKLTGIMPFQRSNERYFAVSILIKAHSQAELLSLKVQSTCKIPANAPLLANVEREDEKLTTTQFIPVTDKANIFKHTLIAVLMVLKSYFYLAEILMLKCPVLNSSLKGVFEGDLRTKIENEDRAIEVLSSIGSSIVPTFIPVPKRSLPYMEISLGSVLKYERAKEAFERAVETFAYRPSPILFPLVRFDNLSRVIYIDTRDVTRVTSLTKRLVIELKGYALGLIEAIERCNEVGLGLDSISAAWYIHKWSNSVVLLPVLKQGRLIIRPGQLGNAALFTLAGLKKAKSLSSLQISYQDFISLLDLPIFTVNRVPEHASPLFQSDSETSPALPFPVALERWYWAVLRPRTAFALQDPQFTLQIVREIGSSPVRLYAVEVSPTLPPSFDIYSDFNTVSTLTNLGKKLQAAHSSLICHLLLSPSKVKLDLDTLQPYITGFNFSAYQLVVRYVKSSQDPGELDYFDPAVISYIWWKRDKTQAGKRKREKYINRIDWRSDIYSFAMLLYTIIFKKPRPFSYVEDSTTFTGFFRNVVKPHRRPLIEEGYEKDFPKAVDLLRRSWERPALRPTLEELVSNSTEFAEMQQRVKTS